MSDRAELQNPYEASTQQVAYPDSIAFDGVVDQDTYIGMLPKFERYLVLSLAFLIGGFVFPMMIASATQVFKVFYGIHFWDRFSNGFVCVPYST
jgi:hypothetical protein